MTLDEIRRSDALWLTPADVAPVIGCDPNKLRSTAHDRPELLGFPVTVVGTRVKIWRVPFIKFITGEAG